MTLSSLITLKNPHWGLPGPIIDTLLSYLGFATVIVFPLITFYLMIRYFQELDQRKFKASYGSLYEGFRTKTTWIVVYRVWFLIRRILLCCIVILI